LFRVFAERTARALGSPWAFLCALGLVLVWAATGPRFHYSETWQIVINTGTTIVTFLMVFLLQNTQMRDSTALHLKLNELLRAVEAARTGLVNLEQLPDQKLEELQVEFARMASSEVQESEPGAEGERLGGRSQVAGGSP
jgi:low affinity Fe/Cu permease